jgi:FtsP/CotA-like multicopper oxidase with cupredoxin domain
MGQRNDILLTLPPGEGAWPILAQREGDTARTGIFLATPYANVFKIPPQGDVAAGAVGLDLEMRLSAAKPLPAKAADRQLTLTLGEAPGYVWTIDDAAYGTHRPNAVRTGERVEMTFRNMTPMMHPMHLHGHHYQVVAIDGRRFQGAVRDTVIVPHMGSVTVAFDAVNPGEWVVHCHNLYHMAAGMMTTIKYEA